MSFVPKPYVSSNAMHWPCTPTAWSVCPKTGKEFVKLVWDPLIAPLDRMSGIDRSILTSDKEQPWDLFIDGVQTIKDIEKNHLNTGNKAFEDIFAFQCLYCWTTFKRMKDCANHILGRRERRGIRFCIDCVSRVEDDGLKSSKGLPKIIPKPKKFPWAKIVCRDPDFADHRIPMKIRSEFNKFHSP